MEVKEGSGYLFAASRINDSSPSRLKHRDPTNRQEVLNVLVAQLLQERGLVAVPEQIINLPNLVSRRMPDVLVDFYGLRLAIESEFASRNAEDKASKAALLRVQEGIAHIGMALVYPEGLRSISGSEKLRESLSTAHLHFAIVTEAEASAQLTLPFVDRQQQYVVSFAKGNLDSIAPIFR
jgi:hypothetical protein